MSGYAQTLRVHIHFYIIGNINAQGIVKQLAALAQTTRLAIFRLLVSEGTAGLTPSKLSEQLNLAPATLSFHLKELSTAGLITARQESRFIHYSANYAAMSQLIGYLTENCGQGEPCLPASCCAPACSSQS